MVGAIGEVLGALGVIVTLGYLAVQIRANTAAMRVEAEREAFDRTQHLLSQAATDGDLARIARIGFSGMDGFDPDERTRFDMWALQMTYNWLRVHSFGEEGAIDAPLAEATRRARLDIISTPGYQEWFEIRKHWLPDDFREVLEKEMADSSGDYRPYGEGDATERP